MAESTPQAEGQEEVSQVKTQGGRRDWESASSLFDFGELMIEWLEGKRTQPLHEDPPCPETAEIKEDLKYLNRIAFVTTCSQPGAPVEEGSGQRAMVEGLASQSLAWAIATLGLETDLLVSIYPPGSTGGYMVPVTTEEFHPFTWCGEALDDEDLEHLYEATGPIGRDILKKAWSVVAIDPKWGRKRCLWDELRRVTTTETPWTIEPHPSLGPG